MNFMRCSPRHHSVAFVRGPHVSLHHVSFELRGIDEFTCGTGRVIRSGARMVWAQAPHLAGANTPLRHGCHRPGGPRRRGRASRR